MPDKNYIKRLSDLKKRIRIAQFKAAVRVNEENQELDTVSLESVVCPYVRLWGAKDWEILRMFELHGRFYAVDSTTIDLCM